MKSNSSFAEILSSKIEQNEQVISSKTQSLRDNDPYAFAYMLGHFGKHEFRKSTKDCFTQQKFPIGFHKYQIQARPNHKLNPNQEIAFLFFQHWSAQLERNFTKIDLKKCFRKLAIKLHPDHGGTAQLFIELKKHYEELLLVFK